VTGNPAYVRAFRNTVHDSRRIAVKPLFDADASASFKDVLLPGRLGGREDKTGGQ